MNNDDLINEVIHEWSEWIEMYPGQEWCILAHILASKLETQKQLTDYYRSIANDVLRAKHK